MFLRTASERDLPAVRDLLVETWHATYDSIYGVDKVSEITDEWHSIPSLKARLARPNSEFVVADDGKSLGGMAYAAGTSDPKIVILHQLYVRPTLQRSGLGRLLLEEIEDSFPDARMLRLEVEAQNLPAIAFYRRNGFEPRGEVANCGGSRFAIPALVYEKRLD
ncbi:GNAT family N-acetyltransferase [Mesorhizobium sp. LHD-90]|uniref:GNAT family N-acetyltransferase n=1 Tax=Mesorhizobium sp. LHD-90 TaxID=3071414 RepID=UPI0027E1EBE3|nr:GNAT family N-acetyltransferase [Mesorhizobium sp. LHD-90]MDQ6437928.1 GNAT family N-acetyltransferase [Mesorhizobium sp. LHD-90]